MAWDSLMYLHFRYPKRAIERIWVPAPVNFINLPVELHFLRDAYLNIVLKCFENVIISGLLQNQKIKYIVHMI